jgi:hypothetical protein
VFITQMKDLTIANDDALTETERERLSWPGSLDMGYAVCHLHRGRYDRDKSCRRLLCLSVSHVVWKQFGYISL